MTRAAIKSMTGYGHGAADRDGSRLEVELRGVNHRYFEVRVRLPGGLAALETEVRAAVQKRVRRGRIDIAISQVASGGPAYRVEVNRALVDGYLKATASLRKQFRLRGSLQLESILNLPGAVAIHEESPLGDEERAEMLRRALSGAIDAYETMRAQEGSRLAADILERLAGIEKETGVIEEAGRGAPEALSERLRTRLARLLDGPRELDPVRLAQEVALMAGRIDITEELVRIRGHLDQARTILQRGGGPAGKELDFVMQEMNREANTISSKSEALPICQAALRIRSAVEKIREQVQNVE